MGSRREPLLLPFAILTGLDIMLTGAALGDVIGVKALALLVLGTKAVNAGLVYYSRGKVTPVDDPQTDGGVPLVPLPLVTARVAGRAREAHVQSPQSTATDAADEEPAIRLALVKDRTGLKIRRDGSEYTARDESTGEPLGRGRSSEEAVRRANEIRLRMGTHPRA